jgi:uncharacterized membrane protein required for colicin V production
MDIAIAAIVVLSMARGYRAGFVFTLLRMFGWLVSIAAAIVAYPYVTDFIRSRTHIYDLIHDSVTAHIGRHIPSQADELLEGLPKAVARAAEDIADRLSVSVADGVSAACFGIIAFVALLLVIKLAAMLLTQLFSRRSRKGLLGGIDGLLGLLAGGVKGMIAVYIILALMLPVSLMISQSAHATLEGALFASMFARDLYENNLILAMLSEALV